MPTQAELLLTENDDLFTLRAQTCADCGATFETSRPAERCALCASLRTGQVGPATVQCPLCGIEHQIPVLAPHKLCNVCEMDLPMAAANVAADEERTERAWNIAADELDRALKAATAEDRRRAVVAVAAQETGMVNGKRYAAHVLAASWRKALAAGDGLSLLLVAHDTLREAAAARGAVERARAELVAAGWRE